MMGWQDAHQDGSQDLPPSRLMSPLMAATCLDWENVTQPKEGVPRVSFAKPPAFLHVAGCVQALLPEHITSEGKAETRAGYCRHPSTQPPEHPNPGTSGVYSSSAAAQHCPTSSAAPNGLGNCSFRRDGPAEDLQCLGQGPQSCLQWLFALSHQFFARKRKSRLFLAFGSAGLVGLMCWPSR